MSTAALRALARIRRNHPPKQLAGVGWWFWSAAIHRRFGFFRPLQSGDESPHSRTTKEPGPQAERRHEGGLRRLARTFLRWDYLAFPCSVILFQISGSLSFL